MVICQYQPIIKCYPYYGYLMQSCDKCTYCCKMLRIKETKSNPNSVCRFCNDSGCSIYDERPESCKTFLCAWKQMENVSLDLRPDKCFMLFEKWSDSVMVGVTDKGILPLVMGQINAFNADGISVVTLDHSTKTKGYFLAPEHTTEFVKMEIKRSRKSAL